MFEAPFDGDLGLKQVLRGDLSTPALPADPARLIEPHPFQPAKGLKKLLLQFHAHLPIKHPHIGAHSEHVCRAALARELQLICAQAHVHTQPALVCAEFDGLHARLTRLLCDGAA